MVKKIEAADLLSKRFGQEVGHGIVTGICDDRSLLARLLDRLRWWWLGWAGGWIEFAPDGPRRMVYRLRWWHPSFLVELTRRVVRGVCR